MTNGAINITLNATPELIGVIRTLAEALTGKPAPLIVESTAPKIEPINNTAAPEVTVPAPVDPAPIAMTPITPTPAPAPAPAPAPVNPVPVTATPADTLDALARAGAVLAQSGKMEQALALLAKYGVQTVNQLKPEQYGAFATELRALGAQL